MSLKISVHYFSSNLTSISSWNLACIYIYIYIYNYTHAMLIVNLFHWSINGLHLKLIINIRIMHSDSGWYLMIWCARWHTKLLYESFGAVVDDLQDIVSIFSSYITYGSWQIGWLTFACSWNLFLKTMNSNPSPGGNYTVIQKLNVAVFIEARKYRMYHFMISP